MHSSHENSSLLSLQCGGINLLQGGPYGKPKRFVRRSQQATQFRNGGAGFATKPAKSVDSVKSAGVFWVPQTLHERWDHKVRAESDSAQGVFGCLDNIRIRVLQCVHEHCNCWACICAHQPKRRCAITSHETAIVSQQRDCRGKRIRPDITQSLCCRCWAKLAARVANHAAELRNGALCLRPKCLESQAGAVSPAEFRFLKKPLGIPTSEQRIGHRLEPQLPPRALIANPVEEVRERICTDGTYGFLRIEWGVIWWFGCDPLPQPASFKFRLCRMENSGKQEPTEHQRPKGNNDQNCSSFAHAPQTILSRRAKSSPNRRVTITNNKFSILNFQSTRSRCNPLGVGLFWGREPRVAPASQPWAEGCNPFGIGALGQAGSETPQAERNSQHKGSIRNVQSFLFSVTSVSSCSKAIRLNSWKFDSPRIRVHPCPSVVSNIRVNSCNSCRPPFSTTQHPSTINQKPSTN